MKRIVVATDFSGRAAGAERRAMDLARDLGAELILLHVASEAPLYGETLYTARLRGLFEGQRRWASDALATRAADLTAAGVKARSVVRTGVAWEEIVRLAGEEQADMIVVGTHGRTGLNRVMLGSVTERVVRHAPCPVLTVGPDAGRIGPDTAARTADRRV